MTTTVIIAILAGGVIVALLAALVSGALKRPAPLDEAQRDAVKTRDFWRMPPIAELAPIGNSLSRRLWMGVLSAYLVFAGGLILLRIVELALGRAG